ncbi:MAG: PAS domain S-box protein [Pseudomonadota bacterium]
MLNWRIRPLLLGLALVALIPLLGFVVHFLLNQRDQAVEVAKSALHAEVRVAAMHQEMVVNAAAQLLSVVSSSPSVVRLDVSTCAGLLRELHGQHQEFANLEVISRDGAQRCGTGDINPPIPADGALLRLVVAKHKFTVGTVNLTPAGRVDALSFATPVKNGAGLVTGVALASLKAQVLSEALARVNLTPGATLRLFDRSGTLLAAVFPDGKPQDDVENDEALRLAARTGRSDVQQLMDSQGVTRFYAHVPLTGAAAGSLYVAASIPLDALLAGPSEALYQTLTAVFAFALAGIGFAWWFGGRLIVKPVRAIVREYDQLASGDSTARVSSQFTRPGELGTIAQSFNAMAASLETRRAELETALKDVSAKSAQIELVLNSMNEAVVATDLKGNMLLFNAGALELFPESPIPGDRRPWWDGHSLWSLDGQTRYADSDRPLNRALRGERIDNWEVRLRRPDKADRIISISVRPMLGDKNKIVGGLNVITDITERKASEAFLRAQGPVLELIAGGVDLSASLEAVVGLIEESEPRFLCNVQLVESDRLGRGYALRLPGPLRNVLADTPVRPGEGAEATAAYREQTVLVSDISGDPVMAGSRDAAMAQGFCACWAAPVMLADNSVGAVVSLYLFHIGSPTPRDMFLLQVAVRLVRIALEKERTQNALLGSEARFRELAENVEEVFYNRDASGARIYYISPAFAHLWGQSCESVYANPRSYVDAIHPEDRQLADGAAAANRSGHSAEIEYRVIRPDGSLRWIRDVSYPVLSPGGTLERVVGTAVDITRRKQADSELVGATRALQMLSQFNQALARVEAEAELLLHACRLAVEVGGYRMAWVGYADESPERRIIPMAHAGRNDGYLEFIELTWDVEKSNGRGPAGQVIRTGVASQTSDIALADDDFAWREAALERGYKSALVLPLSNDGKTFGILGLYAADTQRKSADEVRLLQELADNLAFGLQIIHSKLERSRIEAAVFKMAAGLSSTVGAEFFDHLARNMTDALGADAGFIAKLDATGETRMLHCIAGVIDGRSVKGESFAADTLPSDGHPEQSVCIVPMALESRFPRARLALPGAQAYAGHQFLDPGRNVAGLLFVLYRNPLRQTGFIASTLKIFSSRAAKEFDRQKVQAKLQEQASMLDKAQDAIIVCNLDHRILYINRSAERLYAWPAAEAIGESVVEIVASPDVFTHGIGELMQRDEWVGEVQMRSKSGKLLDIESHWTLVRDAAGQPTSVLSIQTDIGKRKRAEEEIRRLNANLEERVRVRTLQLELANKEMESFCYSVSHDLRTPLSAIDGFSSLLVHTDEGASPPAQTRHYINRIRAGIAQMGELIEALLALAKVSRVPLRSEPVDLSAMAGAVLQACRERDPSRQVEYLIQPGLTAEGDPRLLRQLFENLLGNAWKFSSGQTPARIAFGRDAESGKAEYYVRDNGAGFDMAFADKLFSPFQRLHGLSEFEGTGVGLATVQRIVNRHGGEVWGESAPGRGATFYFTLGKVQQELSRADQQVTTLM